MKHFGSSIETFVLAALVLGCCAPAHASKPTRRSRRPARTARMVIPPRGPVLDEMADTLKLPVGVLAIRLKGLDDLMVSFFEEPLRGLFPLSAELTKFIEPLSPETRVAYIERLPSLEIIATPRQRAVLEGIAAAIRIPGEKTVWVNHYPSIPRAALLLNDLSRKSGNRPPVDEVPVAANREATPAPISARSEARAEERDVPRNLRFLFHPNQPKQTPEVLPTLGNVQDYNSWMKQDFASTLDAMCGGKITTPNDERLDMMTPSWTGTPLASIAPHAENFIVREGKIVGVVYSGANPKDRYVGAGTNEHWVDTDGNMLATLPRWASNQTLTYTEWYAQTYLPLSATTPNHLPGLQGYVYRVWLPSQVPNELQTASFFFECRTNRDVPTLLPTFDLREFLACLHRDWSVPLANYFCSRLPPPPVGARNGPPPNPGTDVRGSNRAIVPYRVPFENHLNRMGLGRPRW